MMIPKIGQRVAVFEIVDTKYNIWYPVTVESYTIAGERGTEIVDSVTTDLADFYENYVMFEDYQSLLLFLAEKFKAEDESPI